MISSTQHNVRKHPLSLSKATTFQAMSTHLVEVHISSISIRSLSAATQNELIFLENKLVRSRLQVCVVIVNGFNG